ncbi:hypothetical protein Cs7R123_55330 [Catellatospora sp. TT07R-123]|nr:hypothetical protein Cs7R123_55330 [Catellatospora sp. TT07R-123]
MLITNDEANALLKATAKGSSASHTSDGQIKHIDGCTYISPAGNVGYDINDISGVPGGAATFIQQAKAAMAGRPGPKPFAVDGGDDSVAFTFDLGSKVMARVEVAKGSYTVGTNAVAANEADARRIAVAALNLLLPALS